MTAARDKRLQAIRELVRAQRLCTQAELAAALAARGLKAAQATVSRDIASLGLRKAEDGSYVLPEDLALQARVAQAGVQTRHALNQAIVITTPGSANSVAAAIDAARPEGVLATIAGDDTILVVCADEEAAQAFAGYVDGLLASRGQ